MPATAVYRKDVLMVGWIDFFIGLGWLLGAPSRTDVDSYTPAKEVIRFVLPGEPMRYWGALMTVLALMMLASELDTFAHRRVYPIARALLAAYWIWWVGLFGAGVLAGGGFLAVLLPIGWAIRHYRLPASNPWLASSRTER